MLSKKQLEDIKNCGEYVCCIGCSCTETSCSRENIIDTALHLLSRVGTAETILRDILQCGNVKSCERAIREFLKEDSKC